MNEIIIIIMQRKSLPQNLKEVLLVSKFISLYLVESEPPKYFKFIDPIGNFFKVIIDKKISCSCLPGNNDHCMHTFYVLMKIYQINEEDPLIYQNHYSQQNLKTIFNQSKRINKSNQESKEKQTIKQIKLQQKSQHLIKQSIKQTHKKQESSNEEKSKIISKYTFPDQDKILRYQQQQKLKYEQPKLEKGSICSICYESLQNQTPILKCPSQCFSYFHIKCLKFWVDYQKKQETSASCPMCRSSLPINILDIFKKSQADYIKFYQSFEVECGQCKEQIKFQMFRCLLCKLMNICKNCYFNWKHLSHDKYLMKKAKRAEWSCPEVRNQASMAKLQISLRYVKQFKNQQQMKVLFGENYNKFVNANLKKETMLQYIINSFTSVSKEIFKTYKKLDYQEKDIKCMVCKKGKITQMRRLDCKHFVDQKCLSFLLVNGQRRCPYDKIPFLQSFENLKVSITKK